MNVQTNINNNIIARNKKILGIVATDCLKNTAQAPAAKRTNLKANDTKRPLHSAPQVNNAILCCWLTVVAGFNAAKTPKRKII